MRSCGTRRISPRSRRHGRLAEGPASRPTSDDERGSPPGAHLDARLRGREHDVVRRRAAIAEARRPTGRCARAWWSRRARVALAHAAGDDAALGVELRLLHPRAVVLRAHRAPRRTTRRTPRAGPSHAPSPGTVARGRGAPWRNRSSSARRSSRRARSCFALGNSASGFTAFGFRSSTPVWMPASVRVMGRLVQSSPIFLNSRLKMSPASRRPSSGVSTPTRTSRSTISVMRSGRASPASASGSARSGCPCPRGACG